MSQETSAQRAFPWVARIGGASIALRLMTPRNRGAFQAFVNKQPEDALVFTMMDLAAPDGLARKLRRTEARWSRHLGEIRPLVAPNQRSHRGCRSGPRLRVPASPRVLVLMSYDVSGFHD